MTSLDFDCDEVHKKAAASAAARGEGACRAAGRGLREEVHDGGYKAHANKTRRRRRSLASRHLDESQMQLLRQKINGRERQRMHDLNSALDELREVLVSQYIIIINIRSLNCYESIVLLFHTHYL